MPNINDMFAFLTELMTSHSAMFETMGLRMFRSFAIIMIVWFGLKSALSAASGGMAPVFPFDRFAELLLTIAFGFAMITYYSKPIPGFGVSFSHLVVDQGLELSNQLNEGTVTDLWNGFANLYWGMETPVLTITLNVVEIIRYAITVLLLIGAQAAVLAVVAFGYIATAVAVLVGPIFIPFFIVPQLEWLFWGWFKAFVQYAFYPVIANAYLYVFGNLLIKFVGSHPPPWDSPMIAVMFFPLVLLLVAFTYGILKVPSLVNSLFAGKSGESALPRIGEYT